MKYRKRSDGSLVTKSQLKARNAGTSLPKVWKAATLEFFGVDPVLSSPKTVPGDYQITVANGAVQDSSGNWVEAWQVKDMFTADSDGYGVVTTTVSEKEDAYDSINLEMRSAQERFDRDALLLETDWVVIKALENSESVDADMTSYRQALRDVPSQSGFPDAIVWPTKPTE